MVARLIPSSPKFIFLSLAALIFLPFIAMVVENIFYNWYQQSALNTVFVSLPITTFIISHLAWFVLGYSFLVSVALLSKEGVFGR